MLGVLLENPRSLIDEDHGGNVTRWDAKSALLFSNQIRLGLPLVQLEVQRKSPQNTKTQDSYTNHRTHYELGTVRPTQKGKCV